MKPQLVRIALGVAILLFFVGHAARWYEVGLITRLDAIIYDARLALTMPRGIDARVVILDIDEKSLQEVARWPWPRDVMARLVDKLFDRYQVAILAFDVVFAEPDYSSGIRVLDQFAQKELKHVAPFREAYERLRPRLDNDGQFAQALKGRPVVLGYYLSSEPGAKKIAALPEPVLPKGTFAGRNIRFTSWVGHGGNLSEFQSHAANAGHFNPLTDPDGIVRRVPMLAEYEGAYYEALSLAVVRTLLGFPKIEPGYAPGGHWAKGYSGLEWLQVGPLRIPVDDTVSALIPFRGHRYSFPYFSLADVLHDRVEPERLKGRIALVGTTAPGLLDLRATPVDSVYPGVEIHANLVAGMLDRRLKQKPPYMLGAEVVTLAVAGLVLALLVPLLSAVWASALAAGVFVGVAGLNVLVWTVGDTALPLASSVLMIATLYTANMAYGYFVEARSKRQFTELFGQYVPPELVDMMARDPERYSMEGKSEDLTVLFSDIVGFTSISESLEPKALAAFINEYLTTMSLVIREHRGTLDKYIGDAIMAFWGAPVEDPEHAQHAVEAALGMRRALVEINRRVQTKGWPEIHIGIGLNSGVMRVGDMGSRVRRAYTVMGDPVNLGSRLEGLTREYGVAIIASEYTRERVRGIVFRELDRVRVKGKDQPVAIFEVVGAENEVDRALHDELRLWHQCLRVYRARDWDGAELALLNLARLRPRFPLYELYAERVAAYRRDPPPAHWDGVTRFTEK